jgi:hypothetical protein
MPLHKSTVVAVNQVSAWTSCADASSQANGFAYSMKLSAPDFENPPNSDNYQKHYTAAYHSHKADVYYLPNLPTLSVNFKPGPSNNPVIAAITTKPYQSSGAPRIKYVQFEGNKHCEVLLQNTGDIDSIQLYST